MNIKDVTVFPIEVSYTPENKDKEGKMIKHWSKIKKKETIVNFFLLL